MNILQRIKHRLVNATRYSLAGFRAAWHNEEAFRFEFVLGLILMPAAFWLGESFLVRSLLMGSWLLVMVVEILNSALEAVVDQVTSEYTELAGRAKDMGSAAVMLSIIITALVWFGVILDRWWF